ncbi:EAL domain-containing protein [Lysinibacillus sp. KU-BSD001]|uniref:EAL domain-containing protein n=1 Tax=Lysinibacillus sp. KU-BSD001 TaxID=3141328 RepID=UPI0036E6BB2E
MLTQFVEYESNILFRTLRDLGDKSSQQYVILNKTFSLIYCNELYTNLTNYNFEDITYTPFQQLLQHIKCNIHMEEVEQRLRKGKMTKAQVIHNRKSGASFYAELACIPLQNEDNETEFVLVCIQDVTYTQLYGFVDRLEKDMFTAIQQEVPFIEKLQLVCNSMDDFSHPHSFTSIILRHDGALHMVQSSAFYPEKPGHYLLEQCAEIDYYTQLIECEHMTMGNDLNQMPIHLLHKQLALKNELTNYAFIPIRQEDGEALGVMTIYYSKQQDDTKIYSLFIEKILNLITLAHSYEQKQKQIYQLAYMDMRTGMMNRYGFIERLTALDVVDGVIQIIEPSEFSRIVELYGRDAGEELLKQLYERILHSGMKNQALIGRFSSESIVLYMEREVIETAKGNAEDFLNSLVVQSFVIDRKEFYITLKCGSAILQHNKAVQDAVRYAENALSEAKGVSGTCVKFYSRENDAQLEKEFTILKHLIEALKNKEITAYFQPKVALGKVRITSMEALARWISPVLGFVSPAEFIPIAERAGLVREIDLQIIEQVLQWFQQRQYEGKRIVPVAINISPEHFYHPHFVEELEQLIKKYYADPNYLIIEITENLGLVDVKRAQKIIQDLFVGGLKTSVDDFGIGHSSLSYLQKLMFAELKIDRSFTSRIHEVGTFVIVQSIIQIAYNLEIDVVAEGIETQEQADLLYQLGCKSGQGYLFYKPMSLEEIEEKNIL